jgi:probable phosphoglycerate mutase
MPATRLIIIRHGETEWNVEGRVMGQLDSRLTTAGVAQAGRLASRLGPINVHALYSSDLGRAETTAQTIVGESGALVSDDRLRERHMGIFQGLTLAEMRSLHPQERAEYETRGGVAAAPDGESVMQHLNRTVDFLDDVVARHGGGTVAIVTHGGMLRALLQYVLGIPYTATLRFRRPNAAMNVFTHQSGRWELDTWGDVSHLEGLSALDHPNV